MSTMLTLTVQLALSTAMVSPASVSSAGALQPALVEQVQGWRGSPTTPPPAPPPAPPPVVQPRTVVHPTQAPPPPQVERVARRRGWVWIGGNYEWRGGNYMWVGGHWEKERVGFRWEPGRWDW